MRMNLREWTARMFQPFATIGKPKRAKCEPRPKAEQKTYTFDLRQAGHGVHKVKAMTRSEARAVLKKELGLKRLPVGA
jgi:hypothetical protein